MSRIGNQIIDIPEKVNISESNGTVTVKGPNGEHSVDLSAGLSVELNDKELVVKRDNDRKQTKSAHGLTRSLINNAVLGVSEGFKKVLTIEGVGFRAEMKGQRLLLTLGFSHPVLVIPPDGIEFKTPNQTTVEIHGVSKQLVGEVSSKLKSLRPPEPYKGKGIRYEGEYIRRKAGKTAAK